MKVETIKKTNCPVCKSEEVEINGNVLKCNKCPYVNTNYKAPSSSVKHKALHKENIKKLDKNMINDFYGEVLGIWIKMINKHRGNFPSDVKSQVNKLSEEFQDNLKGFFEMIEKKLELIKENENEKKESI